MNSFKVEILEDGKVSLKSTQFSNTIHLDADNFLKEVEGLLGGEVVKRENPERQRLVKVGANAAQNFWKKKTVKTR